MHDSSSGVLIALALLMTAPAVDRSVGREQDRSLPAQRIGPFVDRDHGVVGHETSQLRREQLHALVEVEVDRAVQVIGRQLDVEADRPLASERRGAATRRRRGRPRPAARSSLAQSRPRARSRRWRRRRWCCPSRTSASSPCSRISPTDPLNTLPLHTRDIRLCRDLRRRCGRHQPRRHQSSSPR